MTQRPDRLPLTLEDLVALAHALGYAFPRERLAAALPEVQRLQTLVRRLQTLPLDDEPPAGRFTPP